MPNSISHQLGADVVPVSVCEKDVILLSIAFTAGYGPLIL